MATATVPAPPFSTTQPLTTPSRPTSPIPPSLDDRATASYVRRTLCAHHAISAGPPLSIHTLLPPLTSSNAVDLQLYAVLAVILKEFVQAWYGRITPDTAFVQEVLSVIAHVTRALEERVRGADVEALLVDELPALLVEHLEAYRLAHGTRVSGVKGSPRAVYHAIHLHPALGPVVEVGDAAAAEEQEKNETAWRHMLVQSLLAVLLPTEDIQNGCLRALVEEIIAEMILGNIVSNRLCEPWALWELITVAIKAARGKKDVASVEPPEKRSDSSPRKTPASRLAEFGLLEKQQTTDETTSEVLNVQPAARRSIANTFWTTLNYGLILFTTGRAILLILLSSAKLLPRSSTKPATTDADRSETRPVLDMGVWEAAATLIELPKRMPWLSGLLSLAQITAVVGPGKVGQTDGALDRLLAHSITTRLRAPSLLPTILRALRRSFFPANTFPRGAQKITPDHDAALAIRRRCAEAVLDVVPPPLGSVYFASKDHETQLCVVEQWLDVLSDPYLNKHLVFRALELIVVRLVPEVAEYGPRELFEERIGSG